MPGLRKSELAQTLVAHLERSGAVIRSCTFAGNGSSLPVDLDVTLAGGLEREFRIYIWTVSHGGRTRADGEYRIQAKLGERAELLVGGRTTLLLGYYAARADRSDLVELNDVPEELEAYVAWDPVRHSRGGKSSSCQVPMSLIQRAYRSGAAAASRECLSGSSERVLCLRGDHLAAYLAAARHGHRAALGSKALQSIVVDAL